MFSSKNCLVFIVALMSIDTNQQFVNSQAIKCNIFCNIEYVIDFETCSCIQLAQLNNENMRQQRASDSQLISKLIRGDKFAAQASSDSCNNDEYWNGNACIPLISLCPGGYHWNGHACIIQSTIKTAALIPSPQDTKCPLRERLSNNSEASRQLPTSVMPTYSTSPMCPFGFVWSGGKCVHNPPSCPSGYIYRSNWCHLTASASHIVESTTLPVLDNILERPTFNGNKWPQNSDLNVEQTYGIEHSTVEFNDYTMIYNEQSRQNCCLIMSPRICRRNKNSHSEQWQCFHHKNRKCNEFCTKPNIYLRPKKFTFVEPTLVMPPPPRRLQKLMQNSAYRETNIDCSGCLNGSYGCSSECFAYNCNKSDCEFIDEDLLCGNDSTADDDNSDAVIDDYETNFYNDICAFTSSS